MNKLLTVLCLVVALLAPLEIRSASDEQARFLKHGAYGSWDVGRPRGKTYEIDFHTDEGTWMSVDIAPDEDWIVFDLLGHIYRVPSNGGTAQSLTQESGVALNYHPRVSPDGESIAFVSDRSGQAGLWVMDIDGGNPRPVFNDPISRITSPTWLPDGSAIVAVREFPTYSMHRRSARIWKFPIAEVTAAPSELVGQPSGSQAYWPTVSPDGQYVYYMHSSFAGPLHGTQEHQHIRKLHTSSGTISTVTQYLPDRPYWNEQNSELAPELSPDGRWLAFARRIPGGELRYRDQTLRGRTALWLRDLESGEERIFADPITLDMQNAHGMKNLRVLPGYSWAKDSRSLVLWNEGKIQRHWLDGRVEEVAFNARILRTASEKARWAHGFDETKVAARNISWPSVSRRHGILVFELAGEIWTLPMSGRRLAAARLVSWSEKNSYYMPEVSPDGERVVFVSWNDHELGHVWVCRITSCTPEQITGRASKYVYPTWNHDGSKIVVLRSRDIDPQRIAARNAISFDLVNINPEDNDARILQEFVPMVPVVRAPDHRFSRLTQHGQVNVQEHLAHGKSMPAVSTVLRSFDPTVVSSERTHGSFPSAEHAQISNDGRLLVYVEDNEVYLTPAVRQLAEYVTGESNRWDGEKTPQTFIKENLSHNIERLSVGGGHHVRWVDDTMLVYASGGEIKVVDLERGESTSHAPNIVLPGYVPPPDRRIGFTGGRIVTLGSSGTLEHADLVVRGSRIECVGQCSMSRVDEVVDVAGKTLVPGFVDVHAHGGYGVIGPVVPQALPSVSLYLAYGVTTTLDPATHVDAFRVAEMIAAGRMTGARVFSTGENLMPAAPQTGPHSEADANDIVTRLASKGAVSVKVFLQPRRDQRQMLGEAAKRLGLSVTNEGADLYYNVGSMLDGHTGFEHPMHYLALYRDATEFFARTAAVYSPTLVVAGGGVWAEEYYQARSNLWRDEKMRRFMPWQQLVRRINFVERPISEYTFPFLAEGVADIRRAGGLAAVGGHGEQWGLDTHWEMWIYGSAQSPLDVLEMASLGGAYMLGLENDIGSLEIGKLADIVILNSNPLEDLQNTTDIMCVMKGGVLYDANTLDELWPRQLPFRPAAWKRDDIFRTDIRPMK